MRIVQDPGRLNCRTFEAIARVYCRADEKSGKDWNSERFESSEWKIAGNDERSDLRWLITYLTMPRFWLRDSPPFRLIRKQRAKALVMETVSRRDCDYSIVIDGIVCT